MKKNSNAAASTSSPVMSHQAVKEAADTLRCEAEHAPAVAVLVDAGQAPLADGLATGTRRLPLPSPPHDVGSEAPDEELQLGTLEGVPVALMQARSLSGGYTAQEVAFPVRVLATLGARAFVLLGTAAGLSQRLRPSDVMLVTDHLNLQGVNPLTGANEDRWGPRFPDMTAPYDADWRVAVQSHAEGVAFQQGIYAAVPGPAPATPAERKMLQRMGADAVGTGLAPEVLAARHMGRRVLAAVAIADSTLGSAPAPDSESAARAKLSALVRAAVQEARQDAAA